MTADKAGDHAESARKGLIETAKGKVKEAAGALLGNDSLAQEGQLRQVEGRAHREAGAEEAVADARGEQAAQQLAERHEQAREERQATARQAGAQRTAAERDRARERAEAEVRARAERDVGEAVVRERTQREVGETLSDTRGELADANQDEAEVVRRHQRAREEAAELDQAAARARADAERRDQDQQ